MKKSIFLLSILSLLCTCNKSNEVARAYVTETAISFYDSTLVVPSATVYLHGGNDEPRLSNLLKKVLPIFGE